VTDSPTASATRSGVGCPLLVRDDGRVAAAEGVPPKRAAAAVAAGATDLDGEGVALASTRPGRLLHALRGALALQA
jgi:hypothetical protein